MIADEKWIGKQERVFLAGIDILKLLLHDEYVYCKVQWSSEKSGDSHPADIIRERERYIFPNDMCIYVNNALMSNWKSSLTSHGVYH